MLESSRRKGRSSSFVIRTRGGFEKGEEGLTEQGRKGTPEGIRQQGKWGERR